MKLYDNAESGNCYKVRMLLAHLDLPFERIHVEVLGQRNCAARQELRKINPLGKIPTLICDDGEVLYESNAILCRLAEGTRFFPAEPSERSRILAWMFFEQNNHEPNIATRRFWVAVQEDLETRAAQLPYWLESGHAALGVMEKHLSDHDWFGGVDYSIADMALFAYTHEAPEGGFELEPYPAVRSWLKRVGEQPGYLPANA